MATATGLEPTQELSLYSVLTDFPNYFQNFETNFRALLAQSNYIVTKHPELRADYDALVNRASVNYGKLVTLKNGVDKIESAGHSVVDWFKGVFGFSGLGFIPLIIAGVSAASAYALITAIANWQRDTSVFAKKLEYIKDQESRGVSATQAAAVANSVYGSPDNSGSTFFGLPIKWLIVGGVLIFLGPPVLTMINGRK